MRRISHWTASLAIFFIVLFSLSPGLLGQSPQTTAAGLAGSPSTLQRRIQQMVNARAKAGLGHAALYAIQLNTMKTVGVNSDLPVATASVIKLGILYQAMVQIRQGKAHWDEPIVLHRHEAVGGSGILTFLDAPVNLTLKDVLTLMVIVSDNTAANLAMDRFGIEPINARLQALGLEQTHLYKKVMVPTTMPMPADQPRFGLGKTTPREMAYLMETIGLCHLHQIGTATRPGDARFAPVDNGDRAVCSVALNMLKSQFYRETIPRYLEAVDATENGTAIASKTGSLDAVRNDVAIVMGTTGPMILSVFTYDNRDHGWTVDNEGEMTIARLAREIVAHWSPGGLDGKYLVPGLNLPQSSIAPCPPAP